ncbi:UNVERIFIED_CONTAM: hypothetical protein RMT77_008566 [Armadillidium vulgare]
MAGFVTSIYNSVFRKTSTFVLAGAVGVFFFERAFDMLTDGLFEHINEGKLWKDIKHKYEENDK